MNKEKRKRKKEYAVKLTAGTSQVAQWIAALVSETDGLNWIPGIHTVKGENQLLEVIL